MTTSTQLPDPRSINWSRQPGLYVSVYRPWFAFMPPGVLAHSHLLTVNGIVTTRVNQRPILELLPPESQAYKPSPEAPAAWIYHQGGGQVVLAPPTYLMDGSPTLSDLHFGGNLAYREDPRFAALVGVDAAIKIFDHHEF